MLLEPDVDYIVLSRREGSRGIMGERDGQVSCVGCEPGSAKPLKTKRRLLSSSA